MYKITYRIQQERQHNNFQHYFVFKYSCIPPCLIAWATCDNSPPTPSPPI